MTSSCIIPSFRLLRSQSSLVFNSLHLWFTTVDAQPLLIKGQEQSYIPCPDPQFSPCYLHTKNSFQKPPQLGSIILPWFQIFTSSLLTVDTKLCNSFLSTYHWLSMHFPMFACPTGFLYPLPSAQWTESRRSWDWTCRSVHSGKSTPFLN